MNRKLNIMASEKGDEKGTEQRASGGSTLTSLQSAFEEIKASDLVQHTKGRKWKMRHVFFDLKTLFDFFLAMKYCRAMILKGDSLGLKEKKRRCNMSAKNLQNLAYNLPIAPPTPFFKMCP